MCEVIVMEELTNVSTSKYAQKIQDDNDSWTLCFKEFNKFKNTVVKELPNFETIFC